MVAIVISKFKFVSRRKIFSEHMNLSPSKEVKIRLQPLFLSVASYRFI